MHVGWFPTRKRMGSCFSKRRFFEDLRYEPHPGQLAIHESVAPRRIVASGVRWGKTRAAAMEGLAASMEPRERSFGWVVSPLPRPSMISSVVQGLSGGCSENGA